MTKAEVTRALQRYRYDQAYRYTDRWVTRRCIAGLVGIAVTLVKDAERGAMTDETCGLLAWAVGMIDSGQARFERNGGSAKGGSRWRVEWNNAPEVRPPPQEKITRDEDWRQWGRCRTCHGERWSAIVISGGRWYACTRCVGPDHWPGMGARAATREERQTMPENMMTEYSLAK